MADASVTYTQTLRSMASALDWSSTKMLKEIPPHVLKQMDELKQIQLDVFAECRDLFSILVGCLKRLSLSLLKVEQYHMKDIRYFSWESLPTVVGIMETENVVGVFYIPEGTESWQEATSQDNLADIGINGELLSKEDFESEFGIIGVDLPEIP
jgi:hypothetical protein